MLRFLADENLHGAIYRGLLQGVPAVDILRVQDLGLCGTSDPELLAWAAKHDRILVTHDKATIPRFALERLRGGLKTPGVVIVPTESPISDAINELLLLAYCGHADDCENTVLYLPL